MMPISVTDTKFHENTLFHLRDFQFFQTAVTNLSYRYCQPFVQSLVTSSPSSRTVPSQPYLHDCGVGDTLYESSDHQLLHKILANPNHLLHQLLPPTSPSLQHYNLRERSHNRQLPEKSTHIMDNNFMYRVLYKKSY